MQKKRKSVLIDTVQVFLAVGAVSLAAYVHMPLISVIGMGILAVNLTIARSFAARAKPIPKWWLGIAWVGTVSGLSAALLNLGNVVWNDYHVGLLAMMTGAIYLNTGEGTRPGSTLPWKRLAAIWASLTIAASLVISSIEDQPCEFYAALLLGAGLLMYCRINFKLRPLAIQGVNTLILLAIALPALDLVLQFQSRMNMHSEPKNYYTYEEAQKDPVGYGLWTRYWEEEWDAMTKTVLEPRKRGDAPVRLRPNGRGTLFHCPISINSKGFRGPEISDDKGNAYRIVALGESTTFGLTLMATDKPWPEVLESMIRDRLKPGRPVQVINAGTPSWDLTMNLGRLPKDILPLKPDMIISYHGYNGFRMINSTLPPATAKPPPDYEKRPLKLLADFEYAVKLARYKKEFLSHIPPLRSITNDVMKSEYAREYLQLIDFTRANHIHLALANYSMAVNTNSDPNVIDFYRRTFPGAPGDIEANVAHTKIVHDLAKQNPEIIFVDTQPGFDGNDKLFIDLMHLTQPGRQHMAEVMFAAIRKTLEQDLGTGDPSPAK